MTDLNFELTDQVYSEIQMKCLTHYFLNHSDLIEKRKTINSVFFLCYFYKTPFARVALPSSSNTSPKTTQEM
jgi:hypothetical protein